EGYPRNHEFDTRCSRLASSSALVRSPPIRYFDRQLPPDRGPRRNEQIRITPIRLVGAEGEQFGIVPTSQALEKAREAGLDLVEVAATSAAKKRFSGFRSRWMIPLAS